MTARLPLLVLAGLLLVVACAQGGTDPAGLWFFDPWAVDTAPPAWAPETGRLELDRDGTFILILGKRERREEGRWTHEAEVIRLEVTKSDDGAPFVREGTLADEKLLLSLVHPGAAPSTFRRPGRDYEALRDLTPVERAERVREDLPVPSEAEGLRFALGVVMPEGGVMGRIPVSIVPTPREEGLAWEFVFGPIAGAVAPQTRVWMRRDLRVLRMESAGEHVTPFEEADVTDGFASVFLFLRHCPAEPLDYELPVLDSPGAKPSVQVYSVRRRLVEVCPGEPPLRMLVANVRQDSEGVEGGSWFGVTADDRTPVTWGMSAVSGVGAVGMQMTNPEFVPAALPKDTPPSPGGPETKTAASGADLDIEAPAEWKDELELPTATTVEAVRLKGFLEIVIRAGGEIGVVDEIVEDPGLRKVLRAHADRSRDNNHPAKPSERSVVLYADRRAPWSAVRSVLDACTSKDIGIYRLAFAMAAKQTGAPPLIRILLPRKRKLPRTRISLEEDPRILLTLTNRGKGKGVRWRLLDRVISPANARPWIKKISDSNKELPGAVVADGEVPLGEVVRAFDALRAERVDEIGFGTGDDAIETRKPGGR